MCRKIAMRYAMNPPEASENEKLAEFVAQMLKKEYGDETVAYMLSALAQGNQSRTSLRHDGWLPRVQITISKIDLKKSIEAYEKASQLVRNSDSVFDHVWIDLNKADTEIRLQQNDLARTTLDNVVVEAKKQESQVDSGAGSDTIRSVS